MKKTIILFGFVFLLAFALASCSSVTTVEWFDGDGSLLYSDTLADETAQIPEKPLPNDSDEWSYLGWREITIDGDEIKYEAVREAKDRYLWRDADGTVIRKESLKAGSPAPSEPLPGDTEERDYDGWVESTENGVRVFTATWVGLSKVLFTDYDGTVLYTVYVRDGEEVPERFIPNDTPERHYTGWEKTDYGFTATYEETECVYWLDIDGTTLFVDGLEEGKSPEMRPLPLDSDKWKYISWEEVTPEGGSLTYKAKAEINGDYFKGNIFKIIMRDQSGKQVGCGSGFVFNKDGWFVTFSEVMEGGVMAEAVFDLPDFQRGKAQTSLDISHVFINNEYKGFFVGKIAGYSKLADRYKEIEIASGGDVGDALYTLGFESGDSKLALYEGVITDPKSDDAVRLKGSLPSGSTYLYTDAEIGKGMRGGVALNADFEVVGLLAGNYSLGENIYLVGAAIKSANLEGSMKNVSMSSSKPLISVLAPELADALGIYSYTNTASGWRDGEDDRGAYRVYSVTNSFSSYTDTHEVKVYADGKVVYTDTRSWNHTVDRSEVTLSGMYKGSSDIGHFVFEIEYMWSQHTGFWAYCDNINYNRTSSASIKECVFTGIGNIRVTDDNKAHARTRFNQAYEWLVDFLKKVKY